MSQEAVSQDLLSILKMFTSPRMGPFENTNAPAPQPPPESIANAAPPPNFNSGNEQQSALPFSGPQGGPPQPVSRRVVPDGDAANQPAPGAQESKLTLPPPGSGAPAPGLAGQPPVAAGAGTMPDFVSSNPVWQAWEAQRRRLYQEAVERQRLELSASGFGDIARAFGANVSGGVGGAGGGGITSPGSSAATGSGALTMEQFAAFKKAQDDAAAEKQDMERIDRIVNDPQMKGRVSKDVLLTLRANHKEAFTALLKDYFSPDSDTKVLEDGTIVSRPKGAPSGTPYTPVTEDPMKKALKTVELAKGSQELIDPALASDTNLRAIAKLLNMPDDPASLDTLRRTSLKELQERVTKVQTAAATGSGGPRGWVTKEIESRAEQRGVIRKSVDQLPKLEYLVGKIDDGMRTGSWIGDTINRFNREIGTFIGVERGTRNADEYNAAVQEQVQQVIKQYGSNASDRDREAATASFGGGLGPESAREQLAFVAKAKVWQVAAHNADIQDRLDRAGLTQSEKEQLEAQKVAYPKPTEQNLRTMNIDPAAVAALKSSPTPAVKAEFRERYGDTMAEWVLGEVQ